MKLGFSCQGHTVGTGCAVTLLVSTPGSRRTDSGGDGEGGGGRGGGCPGTADGDGVSTAGDGLAANGGGTAVMRLGTTGCAAVFGEGCGTVWPAGRGVGAFMGLSCGTGALFAGCFVGECWVADDGCCFDLDFGAGASTVGQHNAVSCHPTEHNVAKEER